jgi:hypothetical protein
MTLPCFKPANALGLPIQSRSSGPFATEADCLNACKEGACCEGTTCTVKPQCQCVPSGVCCGPDTVDVSGTSAPRCRSESESQCIQRGGTWVVGGNCVRSEKSGAEGAWCASLTGTPSKVFKGVGTVCTPNPCGCCGNGETIAGKTATVYVSTESMPVLRWCPQVVGGTTFLQCPDGLQYGGCWAVRPCETPAIGAWVDTAFSASATFTSNSAASSCFASLAGQCRGNPSSASIGFSASPCKIYAIVDCTNLMSVQSSGGSLRPYWAWTYDPQATEYNATYYVFQYLTGNGLSEATQSSSSTPVPPPPRSDGRSWSLFKTVTVNMRLTLA